MTATLLFNSLQLGLLYGLMALGVYITFRILDLPDLTVDGSITLGMAVCVVATAAGHPYGGIMAGTLAGAAAGLCTGLLQTKVKIHPILAGILTMTALYSVNLFITGGKSNVPINNLPTIFTQFTDLGLMDANASKMLVVLVVVCAATTALAVLFKTKTGLAIRATGDNAEMVRSSSINANMTKCLGLAIGNSCVALSGAMLAQYQMFFDVSFGSGMVVIGLASVIIGETLFGRRSVTIGLISAVVGSAVYRLIIAVALKVELLPTYGLKLISAVIVVIALSIPAIQQQREMAKLRRRVEE